MESHDRSARDQELSVWGGAFQTDIATYFGLGADATEAQIQRALYKGTDCGAWIAFHEDGINVGSIVEGSDAEVGPYELSLLAYVVFADDHTEDEARAWVAQWFKETLREVEDEASRLWEEANEADDEAVQ